MHQVCCRYVLYSSRGNIKYMRCMSVELKLARSEWDFGELHLQHRVYWVEWGTMHSLRARQVQNVHWIC
jgi:hypothetical protein